MACAVVEMARCCVLRRAWRPRRQQRRVTRRRGQHGPSSQEERLLYRPRSVKGQAPAATHINLRASDHPAAPGHGCDATMAPGAAFEFGGGSPGSILPLRRQCWCAAAPRPHFPRPIRPEPQSSPPSSALTEPCMPLSGTANGAGTAADGTEGTVRTPGIAAAAAAAAAALSGRDAAAFSSFLRVLNLPPAAAREAPAQVRPLGGPGGAGRPGPGRVVGWGHVGADGRSSGGCWEPRCASARACGHYRPVRFSCIMVWPRCAMASRSSLERTLPRGLVLDVAAFATGFRWLMHRGYTL